MERRIESEPETPVKAAPGGGDSAAAGLKRVYDALWRRRRSGRLAALTPDCRLKSGRDPAVDTKGAPCRAGERRKSASNCNIYL